MKKKQLHTEAEFMDVAWQNMSTLLDKELPVIKKKRRGIFWFWGIALSLSTVLIFCWTYWHSTDEPVINSLPIAKNQPSIQNKQSVNKILIESQKENKKINKYEKLIGSTTTKKSNKSPDRTHVVSTIKRLTPTSPSAEVNTNPSADASYSINLQEPLTTNANDNNAISKSENTSLLSPNKISQNQLPTTPKLIKLTNFEKVPTLKFNISPIPQNTLKQTIPTLTNRLKGKWNFGIYVGILAPKIKSFNAGLHVRYQLNSRWSFHTGLGYAKRKWNYNKALETSSSEEMDTSSPLPDMEMDNTGATGTTSGAGAFGTSGVGTTNMIEHLTYTNFHYFDLPVFVQYRVSPRWSVNLGGQISRLYGYHYQQEDNSYFSNTFDLKNSDLRSTSFQDSDGVEFNKWSYSAIGGVSFTILPKLELYSNYQLGLNQRFKSNIDTSKWMQGAVGVRVYFR